MDLILVIGIILLGIPYLFGLGFIYTAYRFVRKPEVDKTAGFLWFIATVWSLATQTDSLAKALPFIAQDLTEALNIRPDDGRTT